MDVISHLKIIAVLTAVIFVATAAPAPAAVLTGVDRAHGARFSLSPRTLTIPLVDTASRRGRSLHAAAVLR